MNKDLIKKRFSKNLKTYNSNAKIQRKMAEHLINFITRRRFANVLEVGCGTGVLTELAYNNFVFESYTANDIVENCESYIKKISKQINFEPSDIEDFLRGHSDKYDLILSNAVFQWIENYETFIELLISRLRSKGVLLFSTFGCRNFIEIRQILGCSLPYISVEEYERLLKNKRYSIKEEIYTLKFRTPQDVLQHIKLTGANAVYEAKWTKSDMLNFIKRYNDLCSGSPILTYNPIYVKIYKD